MNLQLFIIAADAYAALKSYYYIDEFRNSRDATIKNESINDVLWLIDNNRIAFESYVNSMNIIPHIDIVAIESEFNPVLERESTNGFESMFIDSFEEKDEFLDEHNDRNSNKLQMLKLFNTYVDLRINNTMSKALLPIYGFIGSESEIEDHFKLDTRATVTIYDASPMDELNQAESIGNRLYDIFFSNNKIGSSEEVIKNALNDPEIRFTQRLRELFYLVIEKYQDSLNVRETYNGKPVYDLYIRLGTILKLELKSANINIKRLTSLISDIIIILECIFILSNDRCNVL